MVSTDFQLLGLADSCVVPLKEIELNLPDGGSGQPTSPTATENERFWPRSASLANMSNCALEFGSRFSVPGSVTVGAAFALTTTFVGPAADVQPLTVMVTAGASAPESVVQDLINHLEQKYDATIESRTVREEHVRFPLPKQLRLVMA